MPDLQSAEKYLVPIFAATLELRLLKQSRTRALCHLFESANPDPLQQQRPQPRPQQGLTQRYHASRRRERPSKNRKPCDDSILTPLVDSQLSPM